MTDDVHLLDVVALTEGIPDRNLARGQVGTVVEVLGDDVFEVEFSDNEGRTYDMAAIPASELIVLQYEPASIG